MPMPPPKVEEKELGSELEESPVAGSLEDDAASVLTEDEEDLEDYCRGGYHPVHVGDTFSDGR